MTVAFYGEDLAYTHASGFADMGEAAAERMLEELGKSKNQTGLIVELGCGPGVTAAHLLANKYEVMGIDTSPAMIELARATAPRGEFIHASWVDFEIPPCDGVIAANEVLNYVSDGVTLKTLERLFGRVFKALWPGGIFLFDLAGPGRVPDGGPVTNTLVGDDWATIVTASEDRRGLLTRHITNLRKVDGAIRVTEEEHLQRLIAPAKAQEMLRKIGFRVRTAQGYRGERAAVAHTVFIARRP